MRPADRQHRLSVSLQQMVQFGQNPSQGTLLRASQFLLGTRYEAIYHIYAYIPIMVPCHEKRNSPCD